jgi:putative heme iron utilization protein
MSELINPAISDRICQHMNEDHGEAVALYAKVFGNTPQAESATMVSIDPQGMNLDVLVASETIPVRVKFDRPLKDAEDAHHTLIDMVKQARSASK